MSIMCFAGLPGSGKSYGAIENVVIPALKAKRVVAHNLTLNESALSVVVGHDVSKQLVQLGRDDTPEEIITKCPPGCVIVLDEVWRYWPAGLKANEVPKDELKFFKEHRHRVGDDGFSSEILIIDQDPKTGIPSFLRSLVDTTFIHTNFKMLGQKKKYRVDVYHRCQPVDKPSKGARLKQMVGTYKPEVYNCYVSHTQAKNMGEAGLEEQPDQRANVLKSWTVRASIAAAILAPLALWWAVSSFFAMGGKPVKDAGKPAPVAAQAATKPAPPSVAPLPAPAAPVVPAGPPESQRWTLTGIITVRKKRMALIEAMSGPRWVSLDLCRLDLEWVCVVDGELVAAWTGAAPSAFSANGYAVAPVQ